MKKSIFHVAVLGLLTSIAAISCDDNTDVCQEHILTQDEINEMARQDSIKEVQKNQINADLILEYQADITISQVAEGGNLAASKIRNLECPNYEICLIDYGCGKFNRKIHIMEQYP